MKYSPCLSFMLHPSAFLWWESISHFGVWYETLRGCNILLKCILIVPHGSHFKSLWLWKEGESDHLGGRPNWKQGLLNEAKKMSEFIVSAVVVVEGCNGCLLRARCVNLCFKVIFANVFIFLMACKEKLTVIQTVTVYGLKWYTVYAQYNTQF